MKRVLTLPCMIVTTLLFCCTNSNTVGPRVDGGVLNGNPVISGIVTTENGLPSKNTIVKLIPSNNNPLESDTTTAYTITNDSGKYSFDSITSGTYNVFGETVDKKLSFKDSVTVDTSKKIISSNIVKKPGYMKGVIKLQPYRSCMVLILLLGTNIYTSTIDTMGNFLSPKIPEGTYTVMILSTLKEFSDTTITIAIKSNQTTLLDTINLSYEGGAIDSSLLNKFHDFKTNLPGTYRGVVTTPWVEPYEVAFKIDSNGHYSAYNITSTDLPALYYGTDKDVPAKKLSLVNINAAGLAEGTIDVFFDYDGSFGTPIVDDIKGLYFNKNFDSLYFDMYHFSTYGPIKFALAKVDSASIPPRPLLTPVITVSGQHDPDPDKAQLHYYIDSVLITINAEKGDTIVYQIIPTPSSCTYLSSFPGDQYWDENVEIQKYAGSIPIKQKNTDILLLARAISGNKKSGVAGYRIRIN